jgi:CBS domain containing-hemolysin-like protein
VRARNPEKNQPFITREEIIHLAGEGKSSGILTAAEHQMIHDVIQLKTKACREIMTPRDKIVSVRTSTTVAQMVQLARVKEHNRFPVFDDRQGAFVGIVHIFDVLADPDPGNKTAADYMRPPQMVADHTPVDHVLRVCASPGSRWCW